MTAEEVVSAAMHLKDTLGKEGIQEIISSLSKDRGILLPLFLALECLNYAEIGFVSHKAEVLGVWFKFNPS